MEVALTRMTVFMLLVAAVGAAAVVAPDRTARGASSSVGRGAFIDTLVYSDGDLHTVRTDGSGQRLLVRGAEGPAWSPDGRQIAFWSHKGGIWVIRSDGTGLRRLTKPLANSDSHAPCCGSDDHPSWSPDGKRIVFQRYWVAALSDQIADYYDVMDLFTVDVRTRRVTRLTNTPYFREFNPAWSPDGRRIAFVGDEGADDGLWTLDLSTSKLTRLTHPSYSNPKIGAPHDEPDWSPDGTRIAYTLSRSSRGGAVAVMRSNGTGSRQIIQAPGHLGSPSWSPDGSHIAYHVSGSGEGASQQPGWLMIARSDGTRSFRLVPDGGEPDWKPRTST